ncbi:MAG: N-6 DNA methylase [Chloroflexi bacterium]|nr:N-6 DNA methylase [Chloroflexota bacterium]
MSKRHRMQAGDWESVFGRLQELVLANSGEDEFEEIFKLVLAKLYTELHPATGFAFASLATPELTAKQVNAILVRVAGQWRGILPETPESALTDEHLAVCVEALEGHSLMETSLEVLDGAFEYLVSRVAKGSKGQYFTPRHVVEFCVRAIAPKASELIADPACGSGGFLMHAFRHLTNGVPRDEARLIAQNQLWGFDFDARAVQVAKALMLVAGDGHSNLYRLNSLLTPTAAGTLFPLPSSAQAATIEDVMRSRLRHFKGFDVILTNPPFAGELREKHILSTYELSRSDRRVERDVLFLERCVQILRPGGRIAIVLPHNKLASESWAYVREWLLQQMQVVAVLGLGRNTFLPHTSQKAGVLFGIKREKPTKTTVNERVLFLISEREGKDSRGQPVLRPGVSLETAAWQKLEHDLGELADVYRAHAEGRKERIAGGIHAVVPVGKLDTGHVLAAERYDPRRRSSAGGVGLAEIAQLVRDQVTPSSGAGSYLLLDTGNARDGVIQDPGKVVGGRDLGSVKKVAKPGDLLISRLRPYLRQVAYVDSELPSFYPVETRIACSTEFYVLRSMDSKSIAFLVPYLLSEQVQAILAASQEGGHHPRVGQSVIEQLTIPDAILRDRDRISSNVEALCQAARRAERGLRTLVTENSQTLQPVR